MDEVPPDMSQQPFSSPPKVGAGRWHLVYQHLLHVETHWTEQLQNQQQRNSALISVNGLLLGFLGFGGLTDVMATWCDASAWLFVAAIAVLAIALTFGVASMWPRIGISLDEWQEPDAVLELARSVDDEAAYEQLATSLASSLKGEPTHQEVLDKRRGLMLRQIVLLGVAVLPLALSIVIELVRGS